MAIPLAADEVVARVTARVEAREAVRAVARAVARAVVREAREARERRLASPLEGARARAAVEVVIPGRHGATCTCFATRRRRWPA